MLWWVTDVPLCVKSVICFQRFRFRFKIINNIKITAAGTALINRPPIYKPLTLKQGVLGVWGFGVMG